MKHVEDFHPQWASVVGLKPNHTLHVAYAPVSWCVSRVEGCAILKLRRPSVIKKSKKNKRKS